MKIYRASVAFNDNGNSPWDALWYQGSADELYCLTCQMQLSAIWKAPTVHLQKRVQVPDIYGFQLFLAASDKARVILSPLLEQTVEFLPLECKSRAKLYAIHPLRFADLDGRAVVTRNEKDPTSNITVVKKYSFYADQVDPDMHAFAILQAKGSSARDGGYTIPHLMVSQQFKDLAEANGLKGVVFQEVWSS